MLQISFLSESQKERIHLAALEILKRTGVAVYSDEAVSLLREAGCHVSEGNQVRIPAHLVEEAVRTAPPSITVYSRDGKPAMQLEPTNIHFGTGSDLPFTIDLYTSEYRKSRKQDIADTARLCDALPNIDFIMSMAIPWDVDVARSDVHSFQAMVTSSTKPIAFTAHDRQGLSDIIAMAEALTGGSEMLWQKPYCILYVEPSSPLRHSTEALDKLILAAENNLPVIYAPGPLMGALSPITMAGALAQSNAEILSAILIAQLKRPGAPCLFGAGTPPLDMRTIMGAYTAPEHMIVTSAMVEMGRYYKLPTWAYGGNSDSKVFDQQATLEGALWSVVPALNGCNLLHDTGYIGSGLINSPEMIVTMDEVIGMVKRMISPIDISDETLAIDAIDEVGPGGNFLSSDHTLRHFRENWYPTLLDRQNHEMWSAEGQKTLGERANEKARQLIETHQPQGLPQATREKLAEILAGAEQRAEATLGASVSVGNAEERATSRVS